MANYNEVRGLLKAVNFALTDAEIEAEMGPPKKHFEKNYSMTEIGKFARELSKVANKKRLYEIKKSGDFEPEEQNGRAGVSWETLYPWLEALAKDQGVAINQEAIKRVLNGNAYRALKIKENFYNPIIRSFASQILREQK